MKRYIIISLVLLLLSALPLQVHPIRKDTKLLLDELAKLSETIKKMEAKIAVIYTQSDIMFKKIAIIEGKVAAVAKSQADNNQDKESLLLSLQFIKEELNELKNNVSKINDRLLSMPAGTAPVGTETGGDDVQPGVVQNPESIYYTAYSDYIKKNYDLAIQGFQQFLRLFPDNTLADNSLYWIGECYYSQKKFQEAVTTFNELRNKYSDGDKLPDAILKEGYALIEIGRQTEGIDVLKELCSRFPLSEECSLAKQKIEEVSD
jgi:tol-pal system protein YbgF